MESANFTSAAPVQPAIDRYTGLLGEPTISVDAGEGDRTVQWHETPYAPWIVGVIGNDGETIVSISRMAGE